MQDFQEPNGDMTWTKHKIQHDGTQRCDMSKDYPNHIQESNQHKIDPNVQWMNKTQHQEQDDIQNTHAQGLISF